MVFFLLSIPVSVACGVAGNLLTPRVRAALDARSAYRRPDRVARIRKELEVLAEVDAHPSRAVAVAASLVGRLLALWAFAVVATLGSLIADLSSAKGISGLQSALGILMPLSLAYASYKSVGVQQWFGKMSTPGWAKEQAEKQLAALRARGEQSNQEHEQEIAQASPAAEGRAQS
jgi:hypothetical protein